MIYSIYIDSVDGETMVSRVARDKAGMLDFLRRYDHEGSAIVLIVRDDHGQVLRAIDSEDIYPFLRD